MKKTCVFILISLLLFTACQPTPEEPLIVGKDQQLMIEKAQGNDASPVPGEAETVDWAQRLGAPASYKASLTSGGGHLTVEVDAPVILPTGELPVARIEPYVFTDEDARRFAAALLGEDLKCVDPYSESSRTRAMWEREILQLKNDLDHWEEYGNLIWDSYDTKADFEKHLQELMAQAAAAPEVPETFPPTWEWQFWNVWTPEGKQETSDRYMTLRVLNEDATESNLTVESCSEYMRSGLRYMRDVGNDIHFPILEHQWPNELPLSREAAQGMAEETLKRMGLDNLACAFSKSIRCYRGDAYAVGAPYEPYWAFVYTPAVNGTPLIYTSQTTTEPTDYEREWQYEQCRLLVDEKGVAFLEYSAPCTLTEVKVDAAALLSFEKIREVFEKMVLIVDNNADIHNYDQSYHIAEVRLGLVSLPEQNGEGGLIVPCWDFLGRREPDYFLEMQGMESDDSRSFLTINAIDGSIIVRQ